MKAQVRLNHPIRYVTQVLRGMGVAWLWITVLTTTSTLARAPLPPAGGDSPLMTRMDAAKIQEWQAQWEKKLTGGMRGRACDKELGEELAWLVSPFLEGFYHGYRATGDTKWIDHLVDWTDSWVKRGVNEPDGYVGWPKLAAAGTKVDNLNAFNADSILSEAMCLRPVVKMSKIILDSPALSQKYGDKARSYIALSEQLFEKWEKRGAWRKTEGGGMITVVLPFGIDGDTGQWTAGYATRNDPGQGFSHPDNKANATACWLLAMHDATGKAVYREYAEGWFRLMKSRMTVKPDGLYQIWNYWQPAGPWDYKQDGSTKHWVGIHPNAGYYSVDVEGIVTAYEHGLVFDNKDIERLIATAHAENRPWVALAPYDAAIRKIFEDTHKPDSWGGMKLTSWYLTLQNRLK